MQELAFLRGGKCLSNEYINSHTQLTWMCAKGHTWDKAPYIIKQGAWCPQCRLWLRLEDIQQIAQYKGGECLSKAYINARTKLKWKCRKGHVWKAMPTTIVNGQHWCPTCAGNKKGTINKMHKLATAMGGKCLSKTYFNSKTRMRWQCSEGHIWNTTPGSVQKGSWCPLCSGNVKATLEDMVKLAKSKGGKCLSEKYGNSITKIKWQCREGHTWSANPGDVKYGSWCPECAPNKKLSIYDMHELAKSKGGGCLSKEYVNSATKLQWQCQKGHKWMAKHNTIINGGWCPACAGKKQLTIEQMQEIAVSRGGKCLSAKYVNNSTRLIWQCKDGHTWKAAPANVIHSGSWCPICAPNAKLTIEKMHLLAGERNGKFLSKKYVNNSTRHKWQCGECGNVWQTTPDNVRQGNWCPSCGIKKREATKRKKRLLALTSFTE